MLQSSRLTTVSYRSFIAWCPYPDPFSLFKVLQWRKSDKGDVWSYHDSTSVKGYSDGSRQLLYYTKEAGTPSIEMWAFQEILKIPSCLRLMGLICLFKSSNQGQCLTCILKCWDKRFSYNNGSCVIWSKTILATEGYRLRHQQWRWTNHCFLL